LSSSESVRRRLALVRGVRSFPALDHSDLQSLRRRSLELIDETDLPSTGPIVLTAGYPVEGRPTNLVTLVEPHPLGSDRPIGHGRARRSGPRDVQEVQ
jgi:pyruvate kinase